MIPGANRSSTAEAVCARITAAIDSMWGGREIEAYMVGICINKLMLDRGDNARYPQRVPAPIQILHRRKTG